MVTALLEIYHFNAKVQHFSAQRFAGTHWTGSKTRRVLPEVLDSRCRATAARMLDSDAQQFANPLAASCSSLGR